MDGLGDLALARELRAEFGKPKQPKLRGRGKGGRDRIFQAQSEPRFQYEQPLQSSHRDEHMSFTEGRKRHRNRDGETATFNAPRKAWHGELVTSTSPGKKPLAELISCPRYCSNALDNKKMGSHEVEAEAFFHQPQSQNQLPPAMLPTPIQVTTPPVPSNWQLEHRQPRPVNSIDFPMPVDKVGFVSSGISSSSETSRNVFPPTSTAPVQQIEIQYPERAENQEDTEMDLNDCSPPSPSKSTGSRNSRGLAASMWNPANRYVRADSVFETSSETTRSAPIVTSGLTKGPGLQASRWNHES
ncbi:hypothetical protein F4678DRAFT_481283 [Xylaria arbuscula]|nr:hypothetical protein F4678DRAFT_481283 [Xylaria arbuscula]